MMSSSPLLNVHSAVWWIVCFPATCVCTCYSMWLVGRSLYQKWRKVDLYAFIFTHLCCFIPIFITVNALILTSRQALHILCSKKNIYTVSQKMHQLWNGIAQIHNDRFWLHLAVCILMKMSTQSRCCWVRKTNLTESHRTVRRISREAGEPIDHQFRGLLTKICVSSAARKGVLNSWLKRTSCTHYFRYAVWDTLTW